MPYFDFLANLEFYQGIAFTVIIPVMIAVKKLWCKKHDRIKFNEFASKTVMSMFESIGYFSNKRNGDMPIPEKKGATPQQYILELRDVMSMTPCRLKLDELGEFMLALNIMEEQMKRVNRENGNLSDECYKQLWDNFKEIKWLKIDIKKIKS